jgi:hypothetical protein
VNTYMRVLIPSLTCVTALCLAAGPAAAKADLTVSVVPVAVGGAPTDEISVTANGGDDAAGYQRLCLQESDGAAWRTLACGPVELGTGGTVQTFVQRSASKGESFRAEVQRVGRGKGSKTVVDLISPPVRSPAAGKAAIASNDTPISINELVGLVLRR